MTMAASVLFISCSCNFPGGHLGDGAPGVNGIYEGTIKIKQRVHVCVSDGVAGSRKQRSNGLFKDLKENNR